MSDQDGTAGESSNKDVHRLLLFLKALYSTLDRLLIEKKAKINTDTNTVYLELKKRIESIVRKPGFEEIRALEWLPFENLRTSAEPEWNEKKGQCDDALGVVEQLFVDGGKTEYELDVEDSALLERVRERFGPGDVENWSALFGAFKAVKKQLGEIFAAESAPPSPGPSVGGPPEDAVARQEGDESGRPSETTATEDNVFRKEGDFWLIRYEGEEVRLKDLKGFQYIHRLVSESPSEIHVHDLAGGPVTSDDAKDKDLGYGKQLGISIADLGDAGEVMDKDGLKGIRRRLEDLETQHASAVEAGEPEEAAEFGEQIEELKKYLSGAEGLSRRPRKATDPTSRAQRAVAKCIKTALDHVRDMHPSLWEHLDSGIHQGRVCYYRPAKRTHWNL
jgi:ribosomal protein S18